MLIHAIKGLNLACRNIFLVIFQWQAKDFNVFRTSIDKTDPFDPLQGEYYWRGTIETMALYRLNIKNCLMGVFILTFLYGKISIFHTVMSTCFKGSDSGIAEFVLLVNIVVSFVVYLL